MLGGDKDIHPGLIYIYIYIYIHIHSITTMYIYIYISLLLLVALLLSPLSLPFVLSLLLSLFIFDRREGLSSRPCGLLCFLVMVFLCILVDVLCAHYVYLSLLIISLSQPCGFDAM